MNPESARTLRGALAGATAATLWAAQQPLDKRVFRSRYDDVELLGKAATRGAAWPAVGLVLHAGNGAVFGAVYSAVAPRAIALPPVARGALAALGEHVALWPAARLSDRFHPARKDLPRLTGNRRAFWQAAWRHALFGVVLGALEARLNPPVAPPEMPSELAYTASSNGHGSLEHATAGQPAS